MLRPSAESTTQSGHLRPNKHCLYHLNPRHAHVTQQEWLLLLSRYFHSCHTFDERVGVFPFELEHF